MVNNYSLFKRFGMQISGFLIFCFIGLILSACSPTTPLFIGGVGGHEIDDYKDLKNKRYVGAYYDDGDLLSLSAKAIRDSKSPEAEKIYLEVYANEQYTQNLRALAMFQIASVYMSRFNDQRDDDKAIHYFQTIQKEFANSFLAERSQSKIAIIQTRDDETITKNARELLLTWEMPADFNLEDPIFPREMKPLARRAVLRNSVPETTVIYKIIIDDSILPPGMHEDSLLQLAFMNLSSVNPQKNEEVGIDYARNIFDHYPDTQEAKTAELLLNRALNNRPSS